MCRIKQRLEPFPRTPAHDRIRAWRLRGHLPHARWLHTNRRALVAAVRRRARNLRGRLCSAGWLYASRKALLIVKRRL